jgi:hypothetical protein
MRFCTNGCGGSKRRSNRRTMRGGQYGPYGDKCGAPLAGGRRKRTNRRGNRRTMRGGQTYLRLES